MIHIGPNGEGVNKITDPRDEVTFAPDTPAHVREQAEQRMERARNSFAWTQARADRIARNVAENLRTGFAGKEDLRTWEPEGFSASIVAAGPSLRERHNPQTRGDMPLHEIAAPVMMLAGSTATAPEAERFGGHFGLAFAVIAEALPITYLDEIPRSMPIVCGLHADPAVFARARLVYARSDHAYSRIADELGLMRISDGVNVATTMIAIAEAIGMREAKLFGVDCCTAPSGQVYAAGTPWASMRATAGNDNALQYANVPPSHVGVQSVEAIEETNVHGEKVLTTREWLEARAWIERFAQRSHMTLTNKSGGLPMQLERKRPTFVSEPHWPTWTDDLADDVRLAREFEARHPEVALFAARLRTLAPRTHDPIESLKNTMAIYQDAIARMRKGWVTG